MKDHYRSQKMALWLNLVPDLQSAASAKMDPGSSGGVKPSSASAASAGAAPRLAGGAGAAVALMGV